MLAGIAARRTRPPASMEPVGIRNGVPLLPRVAVEHHAHLGKAAGGSLPVLLPFLRNGVVGISPAGVCWVHTRLR